MSKISRRIWGNLIFTGNNYFFSINEEVMGDPTLLFLLTKKPQEELSAFLIRSKKATLERLNFKIKSFFLLLDVASINTFWIPKLAKESPSFKELHQQYKLLDEKKDNSDANMLFNKELKKEVEKAAYASGFTIIRSEFAPKVLANYLSRGMKEANIVFLHTLPNALYLFKFQGSRLVDAKFEEVMWNKLIKQVQKSLGLPKKQVELVFSSGLNFEERNWLHPHVPNSLCIWHLKRELGKPLKKLFSSVETTKGETVLVSGFFTRFDGLEGYLQKSLPKLGVIFDTKRIGNFSLNLLNKSLNFLLWEEGLLGEFSYNTGNVEVRIHKTTTFFRRLSKFLGLRNFKTE